MPPFLDFLSGLRTWDPKEVLPRPFPKWDYVERLANTLESHDRTLVVKSRQMMVTWIGCAYILYQALNSGPGVHLVISKEERSAKDMIDRIRFLLAYGWDDENRPPHKPLQGTILFPELDARIVSLPAAPHAVRGQSPRTVFWDEMAFTRPDEEIWTAVKPAVDSGGRFLGVSTPNGPLGVFYRLIQDNNERFAIEQVHYSENPERSDTWQESARVGLSEARWRREQELSFEGAEGRVYDQFNPQTHILASDFIPNRHSGSTLYRGIDFGYRHPAVLWAEEDPSGNLVVFAELLGDRMSIDQVIDEIRRIDASFNLNETDFTWTAVDPAGAAKTDFGISPVETLVHAGFKIVHRHANISPGVETVRSLLQDASGNVSLTVDPRCTRLLTAFEGYTWAESGDLPNKDGEHDHLMDALRYLVTNLPRFKETPMIVNARVGGSQR